MYRDYGFSLGALLAHFFVWLISAYILIVVISNDTKKHFSKIVLWLISFENETNLSLFKRIILSKPLIYNK